MSAKLFTNGLVFLSGRFKRNQILVEDGIITGVGNTLAIPEGTEIIDCAGKRIIPGLIDIHTHGCMGHDFSTATPAEMHDMMKWYAKQGVTSVLPTVSTDTKPNMIAGLQNLHLLYREQHLQKPLEGHMLGIHLEGPFLGKEKCGAQPEKDLLPVDTRLFRELFLAGGGFVRIADLDPMLPGAFDFIDKYRKDFVISLAHTTCDYATAQRAAQAGVTHITHLFNGMNGLHHREPGLVGALYDFGFSADIICDGIHVHPSILRLMFTAIPEKLIIISDSMSAAGMPDGKYQLGHQEVNVTEGRATLADGTLAGSTTNVYESMLRLIHYGIPASVAITAATESAARAAGVYKKCGIFKKGRNADMLILDLDYQLEKVWISGELFHDVKAEA